MLIYIVFLNNNYNLNFMMSLTQKQQTLTQNILLFKENLKKIDLYRF